MSGYQYKTVPAPRRGERRKGVRDPETRFARTVEEAINRLGAEGWEYLRADTLPSEERRGLGGSVTRWRTLLVFRRPVPETQRTEAGGEAGPQPWPQPEPAATPAPRRAEAAEPVPVPGILRGSAGAADTPDTSAAAPRLRAVRREDGATE